LRFSAVDADVHAHPGDHAGLNTAAGPTIQPFVESFVATVVRRHDEESTCLHHTVPKHAEGIVVWG
jgi:hypothetical protein